MEIENTRALDVTAMVKLLSSSYISLINNNIAFKDFPSVMLWGAPGVGKSQGIKQIANEIESKTGKAVSITDVRLLLFNPIDLRGIPTANEDKTLAVWLKPKIFQMNESKDVVNILFLDEISAAPQSVQAAAYQITLDRTVGEHRLPDNCIVIAAGNRVSDKSVAYTMPKALANRLCHITLNASSTSWHDWAISSGIHPYVIGYLDYNSVKLINFESSSTSLAFPTPRSWEMVSNILKNVSDDMNAVYPLIAGCIGEETARNLKTWCELYNSIPSINHILNDKAINIPNKNELHIALRSKMIEYARNNPIKQIVDELIDLSCTLPWNFRTRLMHDLYQINDIKAILKDNEIFKDAIRKGLQK